MDIMLNWIQGIKDEEQCYSYMYTGREQPPLREEKNTTKLLKPMRQKCAIIQV